MQSLEAACEEDKRTIKKLKSNCSSLPLLCPQGSSSEAPPETEPKEIYCIFTKLVELYHSLYEPVEPGRPGLRSTSNLLDKLVARERLNTLIVNLYPGNKGYSLGFRTLPRSDPNSDDTANMVETKQWGYEEDTLLSYINNGELPPFIVDLLENQFNHLFYSGCIIAEIRDFRPAYPHDKCDIHHVLLRPTNRSLITDVNNIVNDKVDWSSEEIQQLESQLLLANNPHLCLDPDAELGTFMCRKSNSSRMWNSHKLRRSAKKFSQGYIYNKRKLDQFTQRPGLELFEFLSRSKAKAKTVLSPSAKVKKHQEERVGPVPVPILDPPPIAPPQNIEINEFKTYPRPKETSDCQPQLIEEYVLETDMPSKDKSNPRVYHIKLSILQRPSNLEYLGELYLDRDHKKNERNGVACRFSLGSRTNANRYIHQFTEIFTESGRKSVRIQYGLSSGYKERVAIAQQQMQAQNSGLQGSQSNESMQGQSCAPLIANGTIPSGLGTQNTQAPLINHMQGSSQIKLTNEEGEKKLNTLTNKMISFRQQFQSTGGAKQQPQKLSSTGSNPAILNILNSSLASNVNSDASAAVVNAINNSSLLSLQTQNVNQKQLPRKMTISNVSNARFLNQGNLIAINNNRIAVSEVSNQQPQTITLASGNFANYTTVPIKQPISSQRTLNSIESNQPALSALLVDIPAANRPEIVSSNANSILLENLAASSNANSSHFVQSSKSNQFMVQSPKGTTVLSSPPPHNSNTINVQSLNFAQLQNVQVQLSGYAQPISVLNVSSTNNLQHPNSLIVSVPVTTTSGVNSTTQAGSNSGVHSLVGGQTVVLANAGTSNLAQLITTGVKGIGTQNIRSANPQTVTLSQGQPFQLITSLQKPRVQQTVDAAQALPPNTSLSSQMQKQVQLQQYQQLCMNQQINVPTSLNKLRRRSNASEPQ